MLSLLLLSGCALIIAVAVQSHAEVSIEDVIPPVTRCYTDEYNAELIENDPSVGLSMWAVEEHYKNYVASSAAEKQAQQAMQPAVIEIPVVFHIIYNVNNVGQNIDYEQIISNLNVINWDFSKTNPDWPNTPNEWTNLVTDYEYSFKLSRIIRVASSTNTWSTNNNMKYSSSGGSDAHDSRHQLNIWICVLSGGILGYAQFPGGSWTTDGVVILTTATGSRAYDYTSSWDLAGIYDLGRTLTHEIGHWIDLRHIWGDGGCTATDFVDDTPSASGASYNCPNYPQNTCGTNDMTMNFMDYVQDACMIMFTNGQKERSNPLFVSGGWRLEMLDYFYNDPLSTPFVNAIYFNVSSEAAANGGGCATGDIFNPLNLNEGIGDSAFIYGCTQKTTNYYTDIIVDIRVVSAANECQNNDVFVSTDLNYGAPLSSPVYACYTKQAIVGSGNVVGLSDVAYLVVAEGCMGGNQVFDGYTIIAGDLNEGLLGDPVCIGVKYATFSAPNAQQTQQVSQETSNDKQSSPTPGVTHWYASAGSEMVYIVFGCIAFVTLLIAAVVIAVNFRSIKKIQFSKTNVNKTGNSYEKFNADNEMDNTYYGSNNVIIA